LTDTASAAKVKKLYLIDLSGATEISNVAKIDLGAASNTIVPVHKTMFLDIVDKLTAAGIDARLIPSKIEGVTFGQDITMTVNGQTLIRHTIYVERELALLVRRIDQRHRAVVRRAYDRGFDAWQRPAHGARTNVHRRVVGDHDAAGLGLPPVVVERYSERLHTPENGLGIERLADAGEKAQRRHRASASGIESCLHHHPDRRGRGVPDAHFVAREDVVPALGVEIRLVNGAGDAVRERRDDAVGRAGDRSGRRTTGGLPQQRVVPMRAQA